MDDQHIDDPDLPNLSDLAGPAPAGRGEDRLDHLASMVERTVAVMAAAEGHLDRPTPCAGWNVAAVLEHLALWAPLFDAAVHGRPAPYDPAGHRVPGGWAGIVAGAGPSIVDGLRAGGTGQLCSLAGGDPIPGEMVLDMLLAEYIGHGWDLCRAIGLDPPYPPAEAEVALAAAEAILGPEYRGGELFGAEVEVPPGAPAIDRLMAFLGRDPGAVAAC